MNNLEYPYLDMYVSDGSGVALEHWEESWSVDMHRHKYCELLLVDRGSCRHIFNGVEALLTQGDVVLVSAHQEHGYALVGEMSLYNCQFDPAFLDPSVLENLEQVGLLRLPQERTYKDFFAQKLTTARALLRTESLPDYNASSSAQGVLRLTPSEHLYFVSLMQHIQSEQDRPNPNAMLKQRYVEIILLELKKILRERSHMTSSLSGENQRIIVEVLHQIESDLTRPFEIHAVSERYGFSPNYFRKLFKDMTGLTPVQYLNRTRILTACDLIEQEGKSITEAAELVGIYDINYFSRLFKKVTGTLPSKVQRVQHS